MVRLLLGFILAFITIYLSVLFLMVYMEEADKMEDPKPKRYPSIDIIVPAFNEEKNIADAINSLLSLRYPGKMRIIVVDDGSTDNTLSVARSFESKGVVVVSKPNGGKASAINEGLKRADSELVAVLDADSVVQPDALQFMVGYFEDERVMAVTPMMKVWKARTPMQALQRAEYILNSFTKKILEQFDSITVTPGPFSVYRRKLFDELGGFDEGNITEDQEIALRIQSANYRIASSYGAVVYTDAPEGLWDLFKQRKRWYRGFLENLWKYRRLMQPSYGDLGVFILPSTLVMILVGIVALFYSVYNAFSFLFTFHINPAFIFLGPSEFVLLFTALVSFALVLLAARKLNEANPVHLFISVVLMSPLLAFFWLVILVGTLKDKLLGVNLSWKGEG